MVAVTLGQPAGSNGMPSDDRSLGELFYRSMRRLGGAARASIRQRIAQSGENTLLSPASRSGAGGPAAAFRGACVEFDDADARPTDPGHRSRSPGDRRGDLRADIDVGDSQHPAR